MHSQHHQLYVVMQSRNNPTRPVREPASVCGLPNREDLVSCILGVQPDCGRSTNPTGCHAKNAQPRLYHWNQPWLSLAFEIDKCTATWKINTAQYQHDTVTGGIRLVGTGQLISPNLESQTAKQPATAESNAGSTLHELRQQTHLGLKDTETNGINSTR